MNNERVPVGYKALVELFNLKVIPNYCWSYISKGQRKTFVEDGQQVYLFPKEYAVDDYKNPLMQLDFALKYEGINLEIIKKVFENLEQKYIENYIGDKPLGKAERKIWYLYEWLFGKRLDLPDLDTGNYINLFDEEKYFVARSVKVKRQRINDNLLGNINFCPFIRKTELLQKYINEHLDEKIKSALQKYDNYIVGRAIRYFYTQETISTWKIEKEIPSKDKEIRFIKALQQVPKLEAITKKDLIELHNIIVDPRYASDDYRHDQIFVGRFNRYFQPEVHFLPPTPDNLNRLMEGLFLCLKKMMDSNLPPVITAATISFGFVFIHPFDDGNGRIHRFLIHYVLSKCGFSPKDMIFPISAIMLKNISDYIKILELYSKELMDIVDFEIKENRIVVKNNYYDHYAYLDYTVYAEYLFDCIQNVINDDLKKELEFIESYDKAKYEIKNIVDLPEHELELLIKLIVQNDGKLSESKRDAHFAHLKNSEISEIENIIHKYF